VSPHAKTAAAGGFGVRTASPFDIPLIAALHADSFAGMLAGQVWNETVMAEVLAMPGAYGFLAAPGEEISTAGCLGAGNPEPAGFLLGCNRADSGEILSLGTARAWRRRGVARTLLRAAIARAEAAGIPRLFLEVAEEMRRRAISMPALALPMSPGARRTTGAPMDRPRAR